MLCIVGYSAHAQEKDSLLVMFWNVENFFDWTDQGTGESDREFSSYGERHWTKKRFYAKCDAIAKSLMWVGDCYGRIPDVVGFAEVENRGVLRKLLDYTVLRKYDYGIVHYESDDRRGIDVALIYRKSVMKPLSHTLKAPSGMATRDILHVEMRVSGGDTIDFIVNHHPSKYGGEKESENRREDVMFALKELSDSLYAEGRSIVAMGDFNDTPDGRQFSVVSDILENKGVYLHDRGEGTIRYKGKWELIDNFLVSRNLNVSEMSIIEIPFLMTYDRRYPGEKPYRTYSGPRYIGGVSDHCPITICILSPN
jgi:endonuclease/exonuclease/phosphatase family metal-dependent hydrolase